MNASFPRPPDGRLRHAHVLAVAFPIILANVTTPLIGLIDTAVLGQLGDPKYIGAVALGAMIFNMVYWAFGFLRMGTTGLTAQAEGSGDAREVLATLARALLIAAVIGSIVILLQWPIRATAFALIEGTAAVEDSAKAYFNIRIWGTPAALANYALLGWFIGRGKTGTALALQVLINGSNAGLDALFVLGLDLAVEGVALGTLIAEYLAAICGLMLALREIRRRPVALGRRRFLDPAALRRVFTVNVDIMLRTLCLIFAFSWFTAKSAESGDILLAANAVLLQFQLFAAYFLDGFAFAASTLVGQAIGARTRARFEAAVRLSSIWAGVLSVLLSLSFWLAGGFVIDILTVNLDVREAARTYLIWSILAPVAGVAAFQLDGIYIGTTWTRDMRNAMVVSLAIYFAAWAILSAQFGNHGLWASLLVFFIARAVSLAWRYGQLVRATFAPEEAVAVS